MKNKMNMKKIGWILFVFLCFIGQPQSWAQKNKTSKKNVCDVTFNVKNATDSSLCLTIIYNGKYIIKDTARRVSPEKYRCTNTTPLQEGMYTVISNKSKPYFSFIMPEKQIFEVFSDTTGDINNLTFKNSPENDELIRFQKKVFESQKRLAEIKKGIAENKDNKEKQEVYTQQMKDLNAEMEAFIADLIQKNPNYLFSKMQKAGREISFPAPDSSNPDFLPAYYRLHYWDNVDLADSRLIFTPTFEPRIKDYFGHVLQYQEVDTIIKYVDLFIAKIEADSLMYHYGVDWLARNYEQSKIIGHDGVFVHIVNNNHLKGKCKWIDETLLRKYEKRVSHIEPLLIGKTAVELVIPDTTQSDDYSKWISSYSLPKDYTILWFFDPDCPKCNKQTALLKHLYDSLETNGIRNFDVYAVGNDSDVQRWKNYVKDKQLPWTNVGGNKANVDYLSVYNIYESGNPAMFIVNKKHEIILNRAVEIKAIPEFLHQYENIQQKREAKLKKE